MERAADSSVIISVLVGSAFTAASYPVRLHNMPAFFLYHSNVSSADTLHGFKQLVLNRVKVKVKVKIRVFWVRVMALLVG